MTYTLNPDAPADFNNALFLGKACDLAYLPEPAGSEAFRNELGLEAKLISCDNTQAYVGQNDQHIIVAFRGSETPNSIDGLKDWLLTNANNLLILPEGQIGTDFAAAGVGARFHRGFMEALAEIWDPLLAAVNAAMETKERPLWVTGHSLGGALALLAAWRLQRNFVPVHMVCTFGAPMIGNKAAAEAFEREFPDKIYRYVDDRDFVPRLPTMSLMANEYAHCLAEVPFGSASAAVEALKSFAGEAKEGLLSGTIIDTIWSKVQQALDCHLMPNYMSHVQAKCSKENPQA